MQREENSERGGDHYAVLDRDLGDFGFEAGHFSAGLGEFAKKAMFKRVEQVRGDQPLVTGRERLDHGVGLGRFEARIHQNFSSLQCIDHGHRSYIRVRTVWCLL
ncbi:MAG TPA: hypothetical protein DDZ68_11870 [Parvularcula sp.]|nr:hypothetical protein [Parvularcula sp.]